MELMIVNGTELIIEMKIFGKPTTFLDEEETWEHYAKIIRDVCVYSIRIKYRFMALRTIIIIMKFRDVSLFNLCCNVRFC